MILMIQGRMLIFFVYSVSLKSPFKLHLTSDKDHMVISLSVEYGLHIPDHIFTGALNILILLEMYL